MNTSLLRAMTPAIALTALASCTQVTPRQEGADPSSRSAMTEQESSVSVEEAKQIALDAYVYGYPLVTVEMTRRVMTNVAVPTASRAPMGQFASLQAFPGPSFTDVTTPNADTLYSVAWIDVSDEPTILEIPDADGRYVLFPMLDAFTNVFASPGSRTTGTAAQRFAITSESWQGTLPSGTTQLRSPTGIVWIIGRAYSSGDAADLAKVHAFQDGLKLSKLTAYHAQQTTAAPAQVDATIDTSTPVREQVEALSPMAYFTQLAKLLATNPPAAADAPILARMAKIGIVPGAEFSPSPVVTQALDGISAQAQQAIAAHAAVAGKVVNGWLISDHVGTYGTDYLQRAYIARVGLGANLPEDAVYPMSRVDADGQHYSGANDYVLHFDKGTLPPAHAFWSLSMYNQSLFFVANPIDRYSIGSRDQLLTNPDGSVDLFLQQASPEGPKAANWLPAPAGDFQLVLRLYWPDASVLDGTWTPPAVERIQTSR